jgi:UDP-N-acetylglucosamine transferase subunit ALG13
MNKVIIVVPNFERIDKHQYDIARYVEENHYGLVCWKLNMLEALLSQSRLFIPTQYSKEEFFKFEEITQMIKSL